MQVKPVTTSYIDWEPVITAEEVFKQGDGFVFLSVDERGRLFWIENRPEESGRSVLVMKDTDGKMIDVIPKPFSARSRVFEYGGYPYVSANDQVLFVNFADQRIYRISLSALATPPVPVTTEKNADGSTGKYMDLAVSPDGRWLIFAYEKEKSGAEAQNEVGIIDLKAALPQEARTLVCGADFYNSPRFSPDGKHIAWLEWNHPFMPWDSTSLFEAPFMDGKVDHKAKNHIAGSKISSISRFCYSGSGKLIFSANHANAAETAPDNFYNLYEYHKGKVQAITTGQIDFWDFRCEEETVFALTYEKGGAGLVTCDSISKQVEKIPLNLANFSVPVPFQGKIYLAGVAAKLPARVLEISQDGVELVLKGSSEQDIEEKNISEAIPVHFPTEDGKTSYGYFYPPVNCGYKAPEGEKPPVRVLVHGGPIGKTSPGFSKVKLFWTSQGYAVFDVNYRGSIGYGRAYRDALLKKWGILEIQDVKDGLSYLTGRGLISSAAVVSGGSAGGYTVQRLLTFYPELFAAGASYYGIGNLLTLQELTHKYESHFLERLIGGTLETHLKEYKDRSPINHLSDLRSPMIIFQGADDRVVPPETSREMARILKAKGISYEYQEYPGEGHGFRKKENLIDSLKKEAKFFKSVLRSGHK